MKNTVINILGFNLYEKEVSDKQILNKDSIELIEEYSGLLFTVSTPDLKFRSFSPFENYDWQKMAVDAIVFTIHSMFEANLISIRCITTQKFFFHKLFKTRKYQFYLKAFNQSQKDILSERFLSLLHQEDKQAEILLTHYIKKVIDQEIGTGESTQPEKSFMMVLLSRYTRKYPWIKNKVYNHFILSNKHEVSIQKDVQIKISRLYKTVLDNLNRSKRKSAEYKNFISQLQNLVIKEFGSRYPDYDAD